MNKIWYGMTTDGSFPAPVQANGFAEQLQPGQLWFGYPRGPQLTAGGTGFAVADSSNGVPIPLPFAPQQVALELQRPSLATPLFRNATGNGMNGWMSFSYSDLASAFAQGVSLNAAFGNINTDSTDLSGYKARAGKLITFHGMADPLTTPQWSINYFVDVASSMGGTAATQDFYRLFLIPGMGHCAGTGVMGQQALVRPSILLCPLRTGSMRGYRIGARKVSHRTKFRCRTRTRRLPVRSASIRRRSLTPGDQPAPYQASLVANKQSGSAS